MNTRPDYRLPRLPALATLLLLLFAFSSSGAEELVMEVIPLQHRMANSLIPTVRPLVDKPGTVTGMNNQLIVRTTAANLVSIKAIVDKLDRPLRRLRITVRQDVNSNALRREQALSGHNHDGTVRFAQGDPGNPRQGTVISGSDGSHVIQYRTLNTRSRDASNNTHFLQTVEGQPAFIRTGQAVPLPQRTVVSSGTSTFVQDSIDYRDVTSGFYVIPQVVGNRVTLQIAPQLNRLQGARGYQVDLQDIQSTVSGRLGEWLDVGGLSRNEHSDDGRNFASTRNRDQQQRNVFLKVDEIR